MTETSERRWRYLWVWATAAIIVTCVALFAARLATNDDPEPPAAPVNDAWATLTVEQQDLLCRQYEDFDRFVVLSMLTSNGLNRTQAEEAYAIMAEECG